MAKKERRRTGPAAEPLEQNHDAELRKVRRSFVYKATFASIILFLFCLTNLLANVNETGGLNIMGVAIGSVVGGGVMLAKFKTNFNKQTNKIKEKSKKRVLVISKNQGQGRRKGRARDPGDKGGQMRRQEERLEMLTENMEQVSSYKNKELQH